MNSPQQYFSLRQMELIWAILKTGNMTKAAEELGISQPAVSRMVRHAEDRSGLRLFIKRGSRLVITPEAEELRYEIERVFVGVERVHRVSQSLRQGFGRPIRLAVVPAMHSLLPVALEQTVGQLPGLKVSVKMAGQGSTEDLVLYGDCDIGIAAGPIRHRDLTGIALSGGPLVCVMRKDDPLAKRQEITPLDLGDRHLISYGRLGPVAVGLDRLFSAHGVERQVVIQTGNSSFAAQLAETGCGIALTDPFFLLREKPENLVVLPLSPRITYRPFVFHRQQHVPSQAEKCLTANLLKASESWPTTFRGFWHGEPMDA